MLNSPAVSYFVDQIYQFSITLPDRFNTLEKKVAAAAVVALIAIAAYYLKHYFFGEEDSKLSLISSSEESLVQEPSEIEEHSVEPKEKFEVKGPKGKEPLDDLGLEISTEEETEEEQPQIPFSSPLTVTKKKHLEVYQKNLGKCSKVQMNSVMREIKAIEQDLSKPLSEDFILKNYLKFFNQSEKIDLQEKTSYQFILDCFLYLESDKRDSLLDWIVKQEGFNPPLMKDCLEALKEKDPEVIRSSLSFSIKNLLKHYFENAWNEETDDKGGVLFSLEDPTMIWAVSVLVGAEQINASIPELVIKLLNTEYNPLLLEACLDVFEEKERKNPDFADVESKVLSEVIHILLEKGDDLEDIGFKDKTIAYFQRKVESQKEAGEKEEEFDRLRQENIKKGIDKPKIDAEKLEHQKLVLRDSSLPYGLSKVKKNQLKTYQDNLGTCSKVQLQSIFNVTEIHFISDPDQKYRPDTVLENYLKFFSSLEEIELEETVTHQFILDALVYLKKDLREQLLDWVREQEEFTPLLMREYLEVLKKQCPEVIRSPIVFPVQSLIEHYLENDWDADTHKKGVVSLPLEDPLMVWAVSLLVGIDEVNAKTPKLVEKILEKHFNLPLLEACLNLFEEKERANPSTAKVDYYWILNKTLQILGDQKDIESLGLKKETVAYFKKKQAQFSS